MKAFLQSLSIFLTVICLLSAPVWPQFHKVDTENLRLIYTNPMHEFLVPHVIQCFENSLAYHMDFWNYIPSERVVVTLLDIGDYGNAGATAIPINRVAVMMAPTGFAFETAPANERINTMMNHELVHVMALDKTSGSDRIFRKLFWGKVSEISDNPLTILYGYLTNPRASAPRWFHEGIAVFMETWMAGGLGRAQGAYDEMVFRTMVRDSGQFYDPVGLESEAMKTDFQVGVMAYLYGTRFFNYLAFVYGPEKLKLWVDRTSGSKGYFSSQFKEVYSRPLAQEWSQWIKWEDQFQQTNLDSIRQYPTTKYRQISSDPLGSMSRAYYDESSRTLYAAVNYPGQVAHITAINIDTGKRKKIHDIKGAALYYVSSLAYDSVSGTLFYTSDNNEWRDLQALNIKTGKSKMLQEDARFGDLVYNYADSSLWGVRHFNGISTLVRIPYPYTKWNQIHSWPYGKSVYDIDISPDGNRLTAALAFVNGHQELILMDIPALMAGDTLYLSLHDFGVSNPANFVFSADGTYLYGASYYSGVSNIFRYDFAADSMEAVTNGETGFFRPLPKSGDSLVVFRYTGEGFTPVVIKDTIIEDISAIRFLGTAVVEKYPEIKEWICDSPRSVYLDSLVSDSGQYHAISGLRLVSAYPIVEGYKDYPAYGMRFNLSEPLGMYNSDMTVSYSPNQRLTDDQRFHLNWHFNYKEWNMNIRHNGADFYDLVGPTKTSRKGSTAGLRYTKHLIYDGPRRMQYNLSMTGYWELEKLPDYQNVATPYDKFMTVDARLAYQNRRASLGAVEYEKGHAWQIAHRGTHVRKKMHHQFLATHDFGFPLPISHSSIWIRNAAGFSPGDRLEPFDNFFFGGFGNNWIDYQTEKRYRLHYAFPGVDLNEIAGVNFGKIILEWCVPPIRFRHLGTTSLYLTWARMSIFGTGISTNFDDDTWRRNIGNIGAQIDFRLTLLSHLRLTMSFGYAMAFEHRVRPTDEFMFSMKIL